MLWTAEQLAGLQCVNGFRLRGAAVTRIESLTDGAFALALTFLVIVQQEIPKDFTDLMLAFRQTPVFAASFAVLILFWSAHVRWSRRYGLEDGAAIALSALLVFTMLVFVYPLKIVFGAFMNTLTAGWVPAATRFESFEQLRVLFIVYGTGFILMELCLFGLYAEAGRRAEALGLNALERFDTRADALDHLVSLGIATIGTVLALLLPPKLAALSGYSYFMFAIVKPLYWSRMRRRRAVLSPSNPPVAPP